MTGREANRELRRTATSLLRKNGNDPDKALRAFSQYLVDDATPGSISGAFVRATAAYADRDFDMEKDVRAYLVRLSNSMPNIVT